MVADSNITTMVWHGLVSNYGDRVLMHLEWGPAPGRSSGFDWFTAS